jgi:hypothetical protein
LGYIQMNGFIFIQCDERDRALGFVFVLLFLSSHRPMDVELTCMYSRVLHM